MLPSLQKLGQKWEAQLPLPGSHALAKIIRGQYIYHVPGHVLDLQPYLRLRYFSNPWIRLTGWPIPT